MARRACAAVGLALASALVASAQDDEIIVVQAKTVITVSGEELSPGAIVLRGGKVEAVAKKVEVPAGARVVAAPDSVVMPGLVNPRSRFGLPGYRRSGNQAHQTVEPELDLRPGALEPVREAGFVVLGLIPAGGGIPGNALAVRPLEGAREALILRGSGYLRVSMKSLPGDKKNFELAFKGAEKAIEREEKARKAFEAKQAKAKAEAEKAKKAEAEKKKAEKKPAPKKAPGPFAAEGPALAPKPDPKAAKKPAPKAPPKFTPPPVPPALLPFVTFIREPAKGPRLLVELGRARDLVHFEDGFAKRKLTPGFYLSNGETSDFFHAVKALGEAGATVVLAPRVSFEPYTRTRRNLPAELAAAGARVAFVPQEDTANGFRAHLAAVGELVRQGLPRDVALRGVTLVPANVLGLDHELGSVEKGRRGDLIFLDGDPFEVGTRVQEVWIGAESVWTAEERS
jgi:hypothetical protein